MIVRIVSGGQTGADRGALDAALAAGFACGGWCPGGRRAEDGRLPDRYPLRQTDSTAYPPRTALNVRDSDGTVVFVTGPADGGTELTCKLAQSKDKPLLVLDLNQEPPAEAAAAVHRWAHAHWIETLNVAGPRESRSPGLQARVQAVVARLIELLQE